jgi:thiamine monophosphate kinase
LAATGGEDYALVMALAAEDVERCGIPLTVIGHVAEGSASVRFTGEGANDALRGWDHLA